MYFKTGDIIIFRKKNYNHLKKAFLNFDLDNELAIIKDNKIYQINNYKTKILNPEDINKYEYYYYEIDKELILPSNFTDFKNTFDYVKKTYPKNKINKISQIRELNYLSLKNTNNVGSKNLFELNKNQLNPYALTYLICPLFEYFIGKYLLAKHLDNYNYFFITLMIFGIISARITSNFNNNTQNGMQLIGSIFSFYFITLFLEKMYNYPTLKILDSITLIVGFRIFFTRFVSWFINDINVKIDPDTGIPYNVLLYESIFEGIVPMILCWILKNKLQDGQILLVWVFTYSFFRIIIENYKDSYLNCDFPLTQGQIDVIPTIFLSIWIYMTRKYNKKSYFGSLIILLLYLDLVFRSKDYENSFKIFNIDIIFKKTFNKGFINDILSNFSKDQKLLINIALLGLQIFLTKNNDRKLLLVLASSLNIGERFLTGGVTDYITIRFNKYLKTQNFNISDLLISLYSFNII